MSPARRAKPRAWYAARPPGPLSSPIAGTRRRVRSSSVAGADPRRCHPQTLRSVTSGGLGGETSGLRLRRWLPMNPSIPVSGTRSRGGPMTLPVGRSRRSAPSTTSLARRSTTCLSVQSPMGPRRCSSPGPGGPGRARRRGDRRREGSPSPALMQNCHRCPDTSQCRRTQSVVATRS